MPAPARPGLPRSVTIYVALLALGAVATAAFGWSTTGLADVPTWALSPLAGLLVAGEYLLIRFRYRREVNALNLFEAALCPLLLTFPTATVVAVVAAAQVTAAVVRRNDLVRGSFNVAQWALASGVGSLVLHGMAVRGDGEAAVLVALLVAMVAVGVVNQLAFTTVLCLVEGKRLRHILRSFPPVVVRQWLVGWVVNTSFGLLFAAAMQFNPAAVALFFVPLFVMHTANRSYSSATADRKKLAELYEASRLFARPVNPFDAVPAFLERLCRTYGCDVAELAIVDGDTYVVDRFRRDGDAGGVERRVVPAGSGDLLDLAVREGRTLQLHYKRSEPDVVERLQREGWRDVLSSPLLDGDTVIGVLAFYNLAGLEHEHEGEREIVESLARETAAAIAKGRALQESLEERTTLAEIVGSASDGILTISTAGSIETWNPGFEVITGWSAAEARMPGALQRLLPRDDDGWSVPWERWADGVELPVDVAVATREGGVRWLQCSYGRIPAVDKDKELLVVVARDITSQLEMERLREDYGKLAEREAAQRETVTQLQEAVRPKRPHVAGADLAVHYLASDPSAPTGGDLYDWQLLPDGDLHLAVVDVLGHGVRATKDALMVSHILRILALEGTEVGELLARAESVVAAHDPDLVATALIGRYSPVTGRLRLAGAGHPPALLVRGDGSVDELFAPGIAIGWPGAGSTAVVEVTLGRGDTLVFYTDGLIEATRDVVQGLAALKERAVRLVGQPVQHVARELVEQSLAGGVRRDDSLAMVVRREPLAAEDESAVEVRAVAAPSEVGHVRARLSGWLRERGVADPDRNDILLLVSELAANTTKVTATEMVVRLRLVADELLLEVEDDGVGLHRGAVGEALPDAGAESGRGLFIVAALCDEVQVEPATPGTVVRVRKRLSAVPQPPRRAEVVSSPPAATGRSAVSA